MADTFNATAMTAASDKFMSLGQQTMEAFMKSGQIWATGMQDIGKQMATGAHTQMDLAIGTLRQLAAVKSVKEAFDLQSALARGAVEHAVAESGKLTDASLKLVDQAMQPITARLTAGTEAFRPASI